jgi:hypothetical protein
MNTLCGQSMQFYVTICGTCSNDHQGENNMTAKTKRAENIAPKWEMKRSKMKHRNERD